jgi:hypothetical protein
MVGAGDFGYKGSDNVDMSPLLAGAANKISVN